jgi:hypothetical protein
MVSPLPPHFGRSPSTFKAMEVTDADGEKIMPGWIKWLGLLSVACLGAASDLFAYFDGNFNIQRHFLPNKENHFDWKAYQLPLSWRRQWYTSKNGFQATAGSLSQELFYIKHDIKFQADLHKNFSLLYTQKREEFYKSEPIYQQIEARFGNRYYVSVLGFPFYEKKYENLGLAISYNEPYSMQHVKITYLNQLATYNQKNREDDRTQVSDDLKRTPMLIKLDTSYRLFKKLDLILDLQQELEGVLLDHGEGLEKSYRACNYQSTLLWQLNDQWLFGLAFQRRSAERSHRPIDPAGAVILDQLIDHYYVDFFGNVRFKADDLTFGYLDSGFKNTIEAAETADNYRMRLDSKQVYGKWQRDFTHWMKMVYSLQLGTYAYEKTEEKNDAGYKVKAGLGVIFLKTDRINFLVLTTWAVDSISEGQWDGGNMQMQVVF